MDYLALASAMIATDYKVAAERSNSKCILIVIIIDFLHKCNDFFD